MCKFIARNVYSVINKQVPSENRRQQATLSSTTSLYQLFYCAVLLCHTRHVYEIVWPTVNCPSRLLANS
jgi:hypothetical protein